MMSSSWRRVLIMLIAGVVLGAAPAASQSRQPTDSVAALEALTSVVAAQLRCPVCQGLSIQDSPTELALEMRAVVRDQLAAGSSPAEVKAYFVSKYGEWILLEPKAEGFNLAVYILPLGAILLGAGVVGVSVRRWTRQGSAGTEERAAGDPLERNSV